MLMLEQAVTLSQWTRNEAHLLFIIFCKHCWNEKSYATMTRGGFFFPSPPFPTFIGLVHDLFIVIISDLILMTH
ncbi:hypothetical protein VIGAN_05221000 [Vigna angularis var. angularis]|uniref:Uncharacterized protein n=1 Tax=Vigna angularis var. angularis TaxID=157739 RepID=A0A0S3S739_PHAAN|nr:hypothetical protein VIGAN_05221000 [Vigna angularis var. angularis]